MDELISQDHIISTLTKLIESNKLPHLLFYGPPGTGKTSTILACARKVNGPNFQNMILELNASDARGIDNVREEIKDFASTKKIFDKGMKLIILDEADSMTNDAQAALRRVIEKFTSNTRFCIICNHVNKIVPAIQSRCTKYRFGPLTTEQIRKRLDTIIKAEKVEATEDGIAALIKLASGDMRKVINVLQSTHMAYGKIDEKNVYLCTGNPLPKDIESVMNWLFNTEHKEAFNNIHSLSVKKGLALQDILRDIHAKLMRIKILEADVLIQLYIGLADIEYALSIGASEKLQTSALVALFQIAKEKIAF
uniref:AAA+ ATPase domain-containing protein n=1 Tax=Arcella intermedia TaxID=1963864 RepID=A0A6B2LAS0_9EUKA